MITREQREGSPRRATPAPRGAIKTTINLPEDALASLRAAASARNTTLTEMIRRAVSLEQYLDRATRAGGKILIEEADKSVRELVLL